MTTSHPPGDAPPRGVRAMAAFRWFLVLLMAAIAAASVAYSFGLATLGHEGEATIYYCPMHPQVVQDHPGECPICSMTLVPRQGGGASRAEPAVSHEGHRHNPSDPFYCPMHPEETGLDANAVCPICKMKLEPRSAKPEGAAAGVPGLAPVELSAERVQMIGIRTARASSEELVPELRTVGFVSADESKLARVHTRFSGWIERLAVATTGEKVKRGQVLAGLYNLELLPAQQEYLAARQWSAGPGGPAAGSAPSMGAGVEQDARARLGLFGLSRGEIDQIAKTGKPVRTVAVTAPIGGYVVRKNAVQGTFVQPGTELFEIADLSKVWVLADIYEYEIARVAVGQAANVRVTAFASEPFPGKVAFLYPTVDPTTRTLRVRLELDNVDQKLRPGMYGDVVIQLGSAEGVVVPAEAVVDTGEHQYVFLAKEGGRFEPRRVRVGARSGDKAQILEGLAAGEVVVTTANFLIDSESRLRATIEGTGSPATGTGAGASACDSDFDKAKYPEKYTECRQCERLHHGMGTMEEDCKRAIAPPWR